jgi:hypothetical protein
MGRVFVFVEDEMGEASYEIVAPEETVDDGDADTEREANTGDDSRTRSGGV